MDALKLELRAVDEVHPLISELVTCINKCQLPPEYEGRNKLNNWLKELNQKRAVDTISEEDARQLVFDLESSYSGFHAHLQKKGSSSK